MIKFVAGELSETYDILNNKDIKVGTLYRLGDHSDIPERKQKTWYYTFYSGPYRNHYNELVFYQRDMNYFDCDGEAIIYLNDAYRNIVD